MAFKLKCGCIGYYSYHCLCSTKRVVRQHWKKISLSIIIGILLGIGTFHLTNPKPKKITLFIPNFGHPDEKFYKYKNYSLADELYSKVRVLCWMTLDKKWRDQERAYYIKHTWGKRCNKILFFSTFEDPGLPTTRLWYWTKHRWDEAKRAIKYIHDNHLEDADWFLNVDAFMYVVMENLRFVLLPYNTDDRLHFYSQFREHAAPRCIADHNGYVMSRATVKSFNKVIVKNWLSLPDFTMDEKLPYVARQIDLKYCHRQKWLNPSNYQMVDISQANLTCIENALYNGFEVIEACTGNGIIFHKVQIPQMFALDFLLYGVRPLGIRYNPLTPTELAQQ